MQRNYSLLMTAAIALFSNVCMAQASPGEPYIELTSEQETGKWGLSLAVANDEDKAKVWVDLNNNGQKDENETIGMWEWYWYSRPRTAKTFMDLSLILTAVAKTMQLLQSISRTTPIFKS